MPFQCCRLSRTASAIGAAIVRINARAAGAMNNAGAIKRCRRNDKCVGRAAVAICSLFQLRRRRKGRRRSRQEMRARAAGYLPRAAITSASIFLAPSAGEIEPSSALWQTLETESQLPGPNRM